jgi:hypothetical protein
MTQSDPSVTETGITVARQLAQRLLTAPVSAEEALERIKAYLENQHIGSTTAVALALATIYRWEEGGS